MILAGALYVRYMPLDPCLCACFRLVSGFRARRAAILLSLSFRQRRYVQAFDLSTVDRGVLKGVPCTNQLCGLHDPAVLHLLFWPCVQSPAHKFPDGKSIGVLLVLKAGKHRTSVENVEPILVFSELAARSLGWQRPARRRLPGWPRSPSCLR